MRKTLICVLTAGAVSTAAAVGALSGSNHPAVYSVPTAKGVVEIIPYSNDIFRIVEPDDIRTATLATVLPVAAPARRRFSRG